MKKILKLVTLFKNSPNEVYKEVIEEKFNLFYIILPFIYGFSLVLGNGLRITEKIDTDIIVFILTKGALIGLVFGYTFTLIFSLWIFLIGKMLKGKMNFKQVLKYNTISSALSIWIIVAVIIEIGVKSIVNGFDFITENKIMYGDIKLLLLLMLELSMLYVFITNVRLLKVGQGVSTIKSIIINILGYLMLIISYFTFAIIMGGFVKPGMF